MLLTLTASCVRPLLKTAGGAGAGLALTDLPAAAREKFGFGGLNLSTDLLAGADRARLEAIRERADRVGCACLLLIEPEPLSLADPDASQAAISRMGRVVQAANYLGCNSVAMSLSAEDKDSMVAPVAAALRRISEPAEKLDIAVLLRPNAGLTKEPERLTELIKKVGGFRIGTFPEFQSAAKAKDTTMYLRRLAPYALAISATTVKFPATAGAPHEPYALEPMVKAVLSVGYDGSLAVDYRGEGDVTMNVIRSREALEACLGATEQPAVEAGEQDD